MLTLTDQRGKETTYDYDVFGRLVLETNPLNQTTGYTYDDGSGCASCGSAAGSGNLASKTDPAGRTTYFDYDDADRLEKVTYSGSTDMVEHTYDEYGRRVATFDNRLPTADFPTQTFTWDYDSHDRMISEVYPDGEEVEWTYDVNGRRTSLTDPDGNVTSYIYKWGGQDNHDFIHNPISGDTHYVYTASTGRLWAKDNYDVSPVVKKRHRDDHYYDSLGRVTAIYSDDGTGAVGSALTQHYFYNAASMVTRTVLGHTDSSGYTEDYNKFYGYDDAYRLTAQYNVIGDHNSTNYDYWYNYWYDLAGNRTQMNYFNGTATETTTYDYNDFNQLDHTTKNLNTKNFYYDDNGNLTGYNYPMIPDSGVGFEHNRENRFVEHSTGGYTPFPVPPTTYIYDFSGRLLMRTDTNGDKTKFYYDGTNNLLLKEKPSGGSCWRTKRVYALEDVAISQVLATRDYSYSGVSCTPSGYTDTWYKYDTVGNVIATVDDAGYITKVGMDAFGNIKSGPADSPRLTTKERDSASGLYYFGARWYDAVTGRWVEKDSVISLNYYWGVNNNPVNYVDPDGRFIVGGGLVGLGILHAIGCSGGVASAYKLNLPTSKYNDKFIHCVTACAIQKQCGGNPLLGLVFPTLEEGWEQSNQQESSESYADKQANSDGRHCGKCESSSCEECCGNMGYNP